MRIQSLILMMMMIILTISRLSTCRDLRRESNKLLHIGVHQAQGPVGPPSRFNSKYSSYFNLPANSPKKSRSKDKDNESSYRASYRLTPGGPNPLHN
ncbi:hypothetical protein ABFS83_01G075400 [Erythranthe nasuta]